MLLFVVSHFPIWKGSISFWKNLKFKIFQYLTVENVDTVTSLLNPYLNLLFKMNSSLVQILGFLACLHLNTNFSLVLGNKSVFFRQNHAIAISEAIKYDIKFILGKVLALTVTAGLLKCSNFVNTDSLNVFHLNSPI